MEVKQRGAAGTSIFGAVRKRPSCIPYASGALSVSVPCAAQTPEDARAGIGAARAASIRKEARDWTRGEPFSFKDLIAAAIRIAAVVALTAVADR